MGSFEALFRFAFLLSCFDLVLCTYRTLGLETLVQFSKIRHKFANKIFMSNPNVKASVKLYKKQEKTISRESRDNTCCKNTTKRDKSLGKFFFHIEGVFNPSNQLSNFSEKC